MCSGQAQLLDGLIIVTAEHNHKADVQVVYSITHSSDKDSSNLHCGGYVYAFHESLKPFGSSWVCERSDCRGQAHLLKDVVSVTTVHSHGQLDAENIYEVGSNKPTKRQCQEVGALGSIVSEINVTASSKKQHQGAHGTAGKTSEINITDCTKEVLNNSTVPGQGQVAGGECIFYLDPAGSLQRHYAEVPDIELVSLMGQIMTKYKITGYNQDIERLHNCLTRPDCSVTEFSYVLKTINEFLRELSVEYDDGDDDERDYVQMKCEGKVGLQEVNGYMNKWFPRTAEQEYLDKLESVAEALFYMKNFSEFEN